MFFFFKQKTAYDMRSSDWSSDVCSSYLIHAAPRREILHRIAKGAGTGNRVGPFAAGANTARRIGDPARSFRPDRDRNSVVLGKSVYGRVAIGGCRLINKRQYSRM